MNRRTTVLLALPLALMGGCSATTAGTPTADSSATSTPTASSEAQHVTNPLDPTPYLSKPCDLVPQQLTAQLGVTQPKPDMSLGSFCGWISETDDKTLTVSIPTLTNGKNGGIAAVYKARDAGGYRFADPTEVSGYPAAFADTTDRRAQGKCTVYVGISDGVVFAAGVDGFRGQEDSCGAAQQVAAAVIATLEG